MNQGKQKDKYLHDADDNNEKEKTIGIALAVPHFFQTYDFILNFGML